MRYGCPVGKGWHYIALDLVKGWEHLWVDELVEWPGRLERWRAGLGIPSEPGPT